jgi:hypothetical protein
MVNLLLLQMKILEIEERLRHEGRAISFPQSEEDDVLSEQLMRTLENYSKPRLGYHPCLRALTWSQTEPFSINGEYFLCLRSPLRGRQCCIRYSRRYFRMKDPGRAKTLCP